MALRKTELREMMKITNREASRKMMEEGHQAFIKKAMEAGCPTEEFAEFLWLWISPLRENSHQHHSSVF